MALHFRTNCSTGSGAENINLEALTPISHVDFYGNKDDTGEGMFLYGALLDVRGSSVSRPPANLNNGQQKKGKPPESDRTVYRRMFIFADLMSNSGETFVILECEHKQERLIWGYTPSKVKQSPLGSSFAILEPSKQRTSNIMNGVPVVELATSLIPLESPVFSPKPWVQPVEESSRYFLLLDQKLTLSRIRLVESSCNGSLCDKRGKANYCGCYSAPSKATMMQVLQITFQFSPLQGPGEVLTVEDWNSAYLTEMFFNAHIPPMNNGQAYVVSLKIRQRMREASDYINANGGWTIIGWHRRGSHKDGTETAASDTTVSSDNLVIHPARIYPSALTKQQLAQQNFVFNSSTLLANNDSNDNADNNNDNNSNNDNADNNNSNDNNSNISNRSNGNNNSGNKRARSKDE